MDDTWDAVAIHEEDDVAVALASLQSQARVRRAGAVAEVVLLDPIPLGHKFALRDIATGAPVRKYGEVIGFASAAILAGAHVHVHNLRSRRAQRVAQRDEPDR